VLPYGDVSNSGILLLALSFSRPVIAPDAPTLVEVLGPSLARACYQRGNVDSLEQSLRTALRWHQDQAIWESYARSRAAEFDVRACALQLVDVYRNVVSR
jgi:glycosyltransferase involved in cell wall biosynthesis